MDDVPSSRKGVQLLHSGQREELKSKWRCWYERKISSESNREEIPKWKQLLATHRFSFPKNDDAEYPEVTNPEVINIEDDFYENTLLPEHLSTVDNGTNSSIGDLNCSFQSDNSEPKEPSESEKVDFIIGNYDTEDEKRIENPKFWKDSNNIEDLNADELDYTIENDDVKSEDSVLNPSLLMTRYNLNDNLNPNTENYIVKAKDSSKGLNSDYFGNFKTDNVDCRVENDNSKDKNSIMNPRFFMDPVKDKGFQTDHEKTNLYTDNYNMKRPSDIENRSDLQSNIPIFVSETSEEHSTRYLNDWENLSDFPNVGSTPSVSNTDTDSIVEKDKAPMQYYCPYPPKLPKNKAEIPVKNSRENLVPEADYPDATDLLTEPAASRYTGMEHNSPVDFCPENYMINTNSIANRLGTNTLTIPSAEKISQGDKSTISEHRYDNFPAVSKEKWMELLDSWKIGGRMLRPTQNSARSSVSPISDCSTEGKCRINGTFTSLDRGYFRPAIRYHGSHWISSLGGSSTRQSFSTISRKSEKKKHRRRNIIFIILIALALLAALAMIVGISIFFTKEKALLRAHISLIIDNREFRDALKDTSSEDFLSIAKPLCNEMYKYFLTSELASHFVKCNVIKMVDVDGKVGVFFDLDFLKNSQTDSEKTIEDIIIKKSGRLVKNDKLYLVIRDFLVYVKSIKMTLETVYVPGAVELPDRHKYLTKVEWSTWSECSRSCGEGIQKRTRNCTEFDIQNHLCDGNEYNEQACQINPCSALLRAHISLMIDNIEFHDALKDNSSDDFHSIAKPLCNEASIF
ncbi:unnamed protein product [Mytilus coruscus]|uniref:SEA domain-containing protein n=1 Tax=Mytilus coruscus TaxID=42192 RepID=A0A6J8EDQ5_MYTCO|nr:unnamed protein product [Mytilus coruscus]